ncbi:hypothetical protein K450DRAFT_220462 [Umbelopsis ramanniana AG]|uniref:FAD-binding PCMH-type domain-containing protein n=1 Tax=Umbelopsis ramanniana AG TaxID=1314678 RepID=A0AAD5HIP1_UMBRA|nr:uncharacterized protein K450DRAFT_220462 [Umbelopsis ramanniana AG]KAI8583891.1 hypothetical protein K450DRAFT_220462 [Umbelopsis ramanniana AG]
MNLPYSTIFALYAVSLLATNVYAATAPSLRSCLNSVTGLEVVTSSDSKFTTAKQAFDLRFTYTPEAVVYPSTEAQVQGAVKCAVAANIPIAPRCGGHSYEGYSLGGADGYLVIDLGKLNTVTVDKSSGTTWIGAGSKLGPAYLSLWKAGNYTLPGGTCPSVGVSGNALGGGYGLLGRKHSVLADNVVALRFVNAKGELLQVDANNNPDLFWALRGAGLGSFGVITAFKFKMYEIADAVTTFEYSFPASNYKNVMKGLSAWASTAPDEVTIELNWAASGFDLTGIYLGPKSDIPALMNKWFSIASPSHSDVKSMSMISAILKFSYIDSTDIESLSLTTGPGPADARYYAGKSLLYDNDTFSDSSISIIKKWLAKYSKGYIIIDLWGGAVRNQPSIGANAFVHRSQKFGIEFVSEWDKGTCSTCLDWLSSFFNEMLVQYKKEYPAVKAYQNYIDRTLQGWSSAYYADAWPRLVSIKKTVDPGNVFRNPQSIPVTL